MSMVEASPGTRATACAVHSTGTPHAASRSLTPKLAALRLSIGRWASHVRSRTIPNASASTRSLRCNTSKSRPARPPLGEAQQAARQAAREVHLQPVAGTRRWLSVRKPRPCGHGDDRDGRSPGRGRD